LLLESSSNSPGTIASVDDFYITSNGLGVVETSYDIYNQSLYNYVVPQTLLYWIRVEVANRVATNGAQWANTFLKYNSGTYNNEWMIIDTKLFRSGMKPLVSGILTVVEQLPGPFSQVMDESAHLDSNGYWASYNIPAFPQVYEISGYAAMEQKLGAQYSYTDAPRAQIFARDQGKVQDIPTMKTMIQYNDYVNDPLSLGHPGNAIAARWDLPGSVGGVSAGGAYDAKISTVTLLKDGLTVHTRAGPTADQQPVFCWSAFPDDTHEGHPSCFNYQWIVTKPTQS